VRGKNKGRKENEKVGNTYKTGEREEEGGRNIV